MMDWLNNRLGFRDLLKRCCDEPIPGGPRWGRSLGKLLMFCFFVQLVTGFALWAGYSPSTHSAWESVYHIQHHMALGWFIRGLHYYGNQALLLVLCLYIIHYVVARAYQAPREFVWWLLLGIAVTTVLISVTGELLPWDEKNVAAATVRSEIVALAPGGYSLKSFLVGGSGLSHLTLTRFFALHAGLLPAVLALLLWARGALMKRYGAYAGADPAPGPPYWPGQAWRDATLCFLLLGVLCFFTVSHGAGPHGGAPLYAPYDEGRPFLAPRPPWYFLFLYRFLEVCDQQGPPWPMIGAVFAPLGILLLLAAAPLVGRSRVGHMAVFVFTALVFAAILFGNIVGVLGDARDPEFQRGMQVAHNTAHRAAELAAHRPIGAGGASELLRDDALVMGPRLFARHCASCHRYGEQDGLGVTPADKPTAPDLKDFATRAWITRLLDPKEIDQPHVFGGTKFKDGDMSGFVRDDVAKFDDEAKAELANVAIALSAQAGLRSQAEADAKDKDRIAAGVKLLADGEATVRCAECHQFGKAEGGSGPSLDGYGTRAWLIKLISDPAHDAHYGSDPEKYNMPSFGKQGTLSPREIEHLADWLRGDWWRAPE